MKKTFQHSLFFFVLSAQLGMAVTDTWTGTTSSNMSVGTNWQGGTPPTLGGNDDLVFPTLGAGANYAVTDDIAGALSLTSITLNSTTSYTLSASAGNTFSFVSNGTVTSTGTHTIAVPITLNGPFSIASNSGVVTFSSGISGGTTVDITSGSVVFGSANSYAGATDIHYNAATPVILQVTTSSALPTAVTNDGTLNFAVTGTETFSQVISRTPGVTGGGVQMIGTGTLTIGSSNPNYIGPFAISAGILTITQDNNLGDSTNASNILSLGPGTLRVGAGVVLPPTRGISLTGAGTIDTSGFNVTVQGVISEASAGNGSLAVNATGGSLTLSGANTYSGGTILQAGTLSISAQNNLGTGKLTIGAVANPVLSLNTPLTNFSLPITLAGASTINVNSNPITFSKPISGSGLLTLVGGTITLSSVGGPNVYGGGTRISSGTVVGDTSSIVGNYTLTPSTVLTFNQSTSGTLISSGTYSGVITSSAPSAGILNKAGAGTVIVSGASGATFSGATNITGGTLNVTGSLQGSAIAVAAGATLSGSGTVGPVTSTGGIIGPNGLNTLTVTGAMNFDSNSTYSINIAPNAVSDLLKVTGNATLNNAHVVVDPEAGFYGFGSTYTILTGAPVTGNFATPTSTDSNFSFTTSKSLDGNTVFLNLTVAEPFVGFPASNSNVQSVVNYLNLLGTEGLLTTNTALVGVINALAGQSFAVINDALDQLQPAQYSVFGELQADVGGHLISMFHRRPGNTSCQSTWRVWLEPYGNWLEEKETGMQQGFLSQSYGGAMGIDWELFQNFVLGFGGAYNHSNLTWKQNRGHATSNGYFGGAYVDYTYRFMYFGGALLAGVDHYHTNRTIQFTTINETATGSHNAFDLIAQFSTGMFFGPHACCLFPYLNVDYFLLQQGSFTETGAPGLNLSVRDFDSQTIRTELGVGLQVRDVNRAKTMCLAPRVAIGWTMEAPLYREDITSSLEGESLTFDVEGWDYTWQLLSFTFGLDLSYKCFTFGGEYTGEINGNDKFWGQQASANMSWHW